MKKVSGQVYKTTGIWSLVKIEKGELIPCRLKGAYRLKNLKTTSPIVVGDYVEVHLESDQKAGTISFIKPRSNYLSRRAVKLSKREHLLAANIDKALLMITFKEPKTLLAFVDRYLVSALFFKIPVTLIFNKIDLYSQEELDFVRTIKSIYEHIGYECIESSTITNLNINAILKTIEHSTVVISGLSGVGKSALIKAINPQLDIRIGSLSEAHAQGKHTTAYSEIHELNTTSRLIDTPGIRGFGIFGLEKVEIKHYFLEFSEYAKGCLYSGCGHTHEPQCQVKEAVENGLISIHRYESYLNIVEENVSTYRV